MSPLTAKRVPVRADFRFSFAPQYMQHGEPTLVPDSVTVSGPEEAVREVNAIYTTRLVEDGVQADMEGKIMLAVPEQTFLSHVKVAYNVSVQRFTQAVRVLPIRLLYAPDSLNIELLPATAQVSLFVTLSDYARLNHEDLQLAASYLDLHNNLSGQVQVSMHAMPDYVLSASVSPEFVTVIISQ
jgi:YbbR domain-containing protein